MGKCKALWLVIAALGCAPRGHAEPPPAGPPVARVPATADPAWEGEYGYVETCGRTAGGTGIVIGHTIRIYRQGSELLADYTADGWQTMTRINAEAEPRGDGLGIFFLNNRPDGMALNFKQSDLLMVVRAVPNGLSIVWKEMRSGCSEDGVLFTR